MKKFLTSLTVSLAVFASAPALAEQTDGQQSAQATTSQSKNYSDSELKKFAQVQEKIQEVRGEYVPKIKSAESRKEAKKIQLKANDAMTKAIKQKGLDVKTYNSIAKAYKSQPDVRKRVDGMM